MLSLASAVLVEAWFVKIQLFPVFLKAGLFGLFCVCLRVLQNAL